MLSQISDGKKLLTKQAYDKMIKIGSGQYTLYYYKFQID